MRDIILLFLGDVSECQSGIFVGDEDRVIAEAILSPCFPEQFPVNFTSGLNHLSFRGHKGDNTYELGLALTVGHMLGIFQQQFQATPVVQRIIKTIPCRIDARFTI